MAPKDENNVIEVTEYDGSNHSSQGFDSKQEKKVIDEPVSRVHMVSQRDLDDTTVWYNKHKHLGEAPMTEKEISRLNRKNFWFLLCQTWWVAFLIHLDKSTLSTASTMGLKKDIPMSKEEYNLTFTLFYLGYLIALWPGAALAQRIGHKQLIVGSLVLWGFLLGMHMVIKNISQLLALRFLLGMTESQIVPSCTVLHQAFFPPKKSPWVQLLWWASGSFANVLLTMVAYKLILDAEAGPLPGHIVSWRWMHLICVILTVIVIIPLAIFLPNNPTRAKWLSDKEKVQTISMIRDTHAGISNKIFKWSQIWECICDPKSWLFILHMFFNELPNNTSQQLPLLLVGFGFTPAQSALFNIAKPLWGSALVFVSAAMLYLTDLGVGYTCAISYIPCIIGGIIMIATPWNNKIALVVGTQISTFKPSYLLGLSWAGTTTTGYTKKLTLMSTCIVSASVANMISPLFWEEKYAPYYYLPWGFMTAFWIISPLMCIIIRFYLDNENAKRERELMSKGNDSEVEGLDTGSEILHLNDKDLDLTDRQNLRFVYPL